MTDIFRSWPGFSEMVNTPGGGVWKKFLKGVFGYVPVTFDISVGFNPPYHIDPNDATRSFAIWFRPKKKDNRPRRWFFLFPEHSLAIELEHGMCISWEGYKVRHASISLVWEEEEWISDPDAYSLFTSSCKEVVKYVRVLNAARELVKERKTLNNEDKENIVKEEGSPVVRLLSNTRFEYGRIYGKNKEGKEAGSGSVWFKEGLVEVNGYDYNYEQVDKRDLVRRKEIEAKLGTNEENS